MTFSFELILVGLDSFGRKQAEALFKTCKDCTPSVRNGIVTVGFDRESKTVTGAVEGAMRDVEKAGFKVELSPLPPIYGRDRFGRFCSLFLGDQVEREAKNLRENSSRSNWRFKRGMGRLKIRPVWNALDTKARMLDTPP